VRPAPPSAAESAPEATGDALVDRLSRLDWPLPSADARARCLAGIESQLAQVRLDPSAADAE
jgi:hypothetical protein